MHIAKKSSYKNKIKTIIYMDNTYKFSTLVLRNALYDFKIRIQKIHSIKPTLQKELNWLNYIMHTR